MFRNSGRAVEVQIEALRVRVGVSALKSCVFSSLPRRPAPCNLASLQQCSIVRIVQFLKLNLLVLIVELLDWSFQGRQR